MGLPKTAYPSYGMPDEPMMWIDDEENQRQTMLDQIAAQPMPSVSAIPTGQQRNEYLDAAGRKARSISEAGGMPFITNVPGQPASNQLVEIPTNVMGADANRIAEAQKIPAKPTDLQLSVSGKLDEIRKSVIKDLFKGADPNDIDPTYEGNREAETYILKNKGLFGQDTITPEIMKEAQRIGVQAFTQKSQEKQQLLGQLQTFMGMAEREITKAETLRYTADQEQQRYERNLAEKKAASGYIEPLAGNLPAPTKGGTQDAAIADLPTGQQNVVKKLVNYEIPLPSGMALRTPYWQGILERAASYDPTFDASQYNVRMSLKRDFNSGKAALNKRSINTVIGHLEDLDKKTKALDNFNFTPWNYLENKRITALGDPRVVGYKNAAIAVQNELATLFKGVSGTDQEIKQWRETMSENQSPQQLKETIDTALKLVGSRMAALQQQYEDGMGKPKDFKFLSPKSEKILTKLGVDLSDFDRTTQKTAGIPSRDEYFAAMQKANPGASAAEINEYLNKKGVR